MADEQGSTSSRASSALPAGGDSRRGSILSSAGSSRSSESAARQLGGPAAAQEQEAALDAAAGSEEQEVEQQERDMELDLLELQWQVQVLRASALQQPPGATVGAASSLDDSAGPATLAAEGSLLLLLPDQGSSSGAWKQLGLQRHTDRMLSRAHQRLVLQRQADDELSAQIRQLRNVSSQLKELRASTAQALARVASRPATSAGRPGSSRRALDRDGGPATPTAGPASQPAAWDPLAAAAAATTFEGRLAAASRVLEQQLRSLDDRISQAAASSAVVEEPASSFWAGGDSGSDEAPLVEPGQGADMLVVEAGDGGAAGKDGDAEGGEPGGSQWLLLAADSPLLPGGMFRSLMPPSPF